MMLSRHAAPTVYVLKRRETGRINGRWFRLTKYEDADQLYDEIARWLGGPVDESTARFAEYRNMPSFGPAPRRIWIADYIAALSAGTDPDALRAYVECGGDPSDFKDRYVGWFESPAEFAAHHLRHKGGFDGIRVVDLDDVARSLSRSHYEIYGHYFRRRGSSSGPRATCARSP